LEAGTGIEPVYKDLQSSTSPLCHPATDESLPVFQTFGQDSSGEIMEKAYKYYKLWKKMT
jgi:hypothetical protein